MFIFMFICSFFFPLFLFYVRFARFMFISKIRKPAFFTSDYERSSPFSLQNPAPLPYSIPEFLQFNLVSVCFFPSCHQKLPQISPSAFEHYSVHFAFFYVRFAYYTFDFILYGISSHFLPFPHHALSGYPFYRWYARPGSQNRQQTPTKRWAFVFGRFVYFSHKYTRTS